MRRALFTIAGLLAAGGVMTLATAWACVLVVDYADADDERSVFEAENGWWIVGHREAFGSIRVFRCVPVDGIDPDEVGADHRAPHWWMSLHNRPVREPGAAWRWVEDLRGWPLPAWRSHVVYRSPDDWETMPTAPGFPLGGSYDGGPANKITLRVLPATPAWRGLIVNTLLWALLGGCVLGFGRWTVFRLRRGRGRCPACGYELRGDLAGGCPECGWGRLAPPERSDDVNL